METHRMIPTAEFFFDYYEHVKWADLQHLGAAREIPADEYLKPRGFSFGNIHELLKHEVGAQAIWLDRFEGVRAPVWLGDDASIATLDHITERFRAVHARGTAFMAGLTGERLAASIVYAGAGGKQFSGPLWRLVFHMCQHAAVHRPQLNSMLKLAGGKSLALDYSYWARETGRLG